MSVPAMPRPAKGRSPPQAGQLAGVPADADSQPLAYADIPAGPEPEGRFEVVRYGDDESGVPPAQDALDGFDIGAF